MKLYFLKADYFVETLFMVVVKLTGMCEGARRFVHGFAEKNTKREKC